MARVVSLFLPNWPTDRLRRKLGSAAPPVDVPLVLAGRVGNRRLLLAVDVAAQTLGLKVGMSVTKAEASVPGLTIMDADPAADLEALDRLALWALQRYAPIVAADPPDGLVIDTTGADHLHGGEHAMLTDMIERFDAIKTLARVAVADTWGAAHAFARRQRKPVVVVPAGGGTEALHKLSISSLRLPTDMVADLRVLGFTRIADLILNPVAPLTLRFGPELARRLGQALGTIREPIDPIRPPDLISVRKAFVEPIGAPETIAKYVGRLVVALCAGLEAKDLGAKRLDLICQRVDNRLEVVRVGMGLPVRDAKRLTRLLCDKIETIDPGFGIEVMSLTATLAEPLSPKQTISSLIEEPDADISDLIDVLANRVGADRLYRFAPNASDVPERSVVRVEPMSPDDGANWPTHWPRPSRLLPRPEPIDTIALLPDHPPVAFTWRGNRHRVKAADGPERVFGEWWSCDAELMAVRDYFQVEIETGERLWIYRAGDGEDAATGSHRWFLHGVFG